MPTLSILTPVYNGEAYLHRCLDNLLRQTFSDWEWVIVDDGSTDQSKDIVNEFDDARIRLLTYQPNRGRGYARKLGLESCMGDWVVIWDVDDLHCLDRLETIVVARSAGYDFFCSYAAIVNFDLDMVAIGGFFPPRGALPAGFMHPTMACRRDLALAIGYDQRIGRGVRPSLEGAEDRTLMVTLAADYRGLFLHDVLTLYLADREVSVGRSIASHRSAFRQLAEMIRSGFLEPGWLQKVSLDVSFLLKLATLKILGLVPASFPVIRRMRVPNYGKISPGWVLSPERRENIRDLCQEYTGGAEALAESDTEGSEKSDYFSSVRPV
jgi:glycosyltransferase involved in cell wall biosynthesis